MPRSLKSEVVDAAIASIESLGRTTSYTAIYEQIRRAQEETNKVAEILRSKALPHGLSAVVSISFSLIGEFFKNKGNAMIGDAFLSAAKITPEGAKVWSTSLEGSETLRRHASNVADVASRRITDQQSTTDRLISQSVQNFGDLLRKEI